MYVKYLASMCCTLMNLKHTSDEQWAEVRTLLGLLAKKLPSGADAALKTKCAEMMVAEEVDDDDEDAEELCNCQFTLAYGANQNVFSKYVVFFFSTGSWNTCARCTALVARHRLTDEHACFNWTTFWRLDNFDVFRCTIFYLL